MGELARQAMADIVEFVDEDYDVLFSASWTGRISQEECAKAKLCAVNIHTGLLPEGRGWHPLNWALIWGKDKTGITIHKIEDGMDAGDILHQVEIPISTNTNIRSLRRDVEQEFGSVIRQFFWNINQCLANARQQNPAHVTYAPRRFPSDGRLNTEATPLEQYNFIRAHDFDTYPAFFYQDGVKRRICGGRFTNGDLSITHVPF
jgi:methionyl-tRNA formyltransferase